MDVFNAYDLFLLRLMLAEVRVQLEGAVHDHPQRRRDLVQRGVVDAFIERPRQVQRVSGELFVQRMKLRQHRRQRGRCARVISGHRLSLRDPA